MLDEDAVALTQSTGTLSRPAMTDCKVSRALLSNSALTPKLTSIKTRPAGWAVYVAVLLLSVCVVSVAVVFEPLVAVPVVTVAVVTVLLEVSVVVVRVVVVL
jgi:hypothetical protein